jgi:hypothetical protein
MDTLRKAVMNCELPGEKSVGIYEAMGELRELFDELGAMADRPTIEDVTKQSPGDYVATMKPLVRNYHRQLMIADKLAPCLCEDLQATGCVLMLIGDGKTIVRTAADPNRPEVQLAVEAILATLDGGIKEVMTEGVTEVEKQLGIGTPVEGDLLPGNRELDVDERTRLLQEAESVGWDTEDGMKLRERAKNYAEGEKLT